jgi:hypothetical protein
MKNDHQNLHDSFVIVFAFLLLGLFLPACSRYSQISSDNSDWPKSPKKGIRNNNPLLQLHKIEKDENSGKLYITDGGVRYEVIQDRVIVKLKPSCQINKDIKVIRNNKLGFITIQVPNNKTLEAFVKELQMSDLFESIDYAVYGEW